MENDHDLKLKKQKEFLINFCYFGVIIGGIILILKILGSILTPFLIAFIIAAILNPLIKFCCNKLHINRALISILFVLIFYAIASFIIILIGTKLLVILQNLFISMPQFFSTYFEPYIRDTFRHFENLFLSLDPNVISAIEDSSSSLINTLGDFISKFSTMVVSYVSGFATSIPGIFLKTVITIIVTFFITIDFEKIINFIKRQLPENTSTSIQESKKYITTTLFKCLLSYILILSITFAELAIGLSILKIPNAVLIAVSIAIFDILPVLGTGGIMIPWAIIALLYGNYRIGIGVAVIYVIVTIIRNIIEPKLVGQQVGLHPVVTLISMFVGLHFLGFIGMLGLPITISLLKYLNDKGVVKIFK
ncbi:MAG: sporulation integral membrane protein YtvI [Intestinibacter bartlettii]|uniref:sporulation integral membrane protein YtvI n=1 Tax=Intestinibacter bartlettii TaxID=261299 RepID=UPI0026F197D9|nr:sporulation integral membrane protein YtvI [Intestinibacter bartlettii]MDO5010636.1 sporulation integral membrane protein YtvI [Intestinibacter bartlettii]